MAIDLSKESLEPRTIHDLSLQDLVQNLVSLLTYLRHILLREGYDRFGFPIPLILRPRFGLPGRTQVAIDFQIESVPLAHR